MPAPRQIFDLGIPQPTGPWKAGTHPALVVRGALGQGDMPFVVVPLSTTPPPVPLRPLCLELREPVLGPVPVSTPIWIHACYPTTVPASALIGAHRALLDAPRFEMVKTRLATLLGLAGS